MKKDVKKILNKNKTAVVITVVIIFAAFLIGGGRSLAGQRNEAARFFFDGTFYSADRPFSFDLQEELFIYTGHAANLVTVAARHLDDAYLNFARKGISVLNRLLDDATHRNLRPDRIFSAYYQLAQEIRLLENALREYEVHYSEYGGILGELSRVETRIATRRAAFSTHAEAFNTRLDRFPAIFFRLTGLVRPIRLVYTSS